MASHEQQPAGGPPAAPQADTVQDLSVSRRNFLRTVGAGPLAVGVLAGRAEAQPGAAVLGPGEVTVRFTLNGQPATLTVEPRVTLLDALRTRLQLTGTKRVCDRGGCGACTVILDGRTVYACSMLAIEAQGATIRTVEGLTQGTALHPVQQALCDADGTMCGFCTPGFVMSMVALLEATPSPTAEQARHALDGNICRCGTYPRVLEAALRAGEARRG